MVINKKIKRNMMQHKGTYIISIGLLILSTLLFTLFNTGGPKIKEEIKNFMKDYNVEDAYFETNIPIEDQKFLEDKFNVEIEEMQWKDFIVNKDINLRIYKDREYINLVQVVEGKELSSKNDIVVNIDFYKNNDLNYGDEIKVNNEVYKLVGASASPDYLYPLENDASMFCNKEKFAIGFLSEEDFNELGAYNVGYSVDFNEDNKEEFKEYIKKNFFALKWVDKEDNSRITTINGDLDSIFTLGRYLPIIIMILVSILIAIVVWRLIKDEITQLGTLYALGYSKRNLMIHYMFYPISIGCIGSIIGQVPGVLLAGLNKVMLSVEYNLPKIDIGINIKVTIASILIPLVIISVINYFVIRKALNHNAVDLMKGKLKEEKQSFFEKKFSFKGLSFKSRFKIKDILRNATRSILTILSIVFCGFLLFFVFIMNDTMDDIVSKGYERTYNYKNLYILSSINTEDREGEKFWNIDVTSMDKNNKEVVYTLDCREKNNTHIKLYDKGGKELSLSNVIISEPLANKLGVSIGDTINVKSSFDDSKFNVKIEKIADYNLGEVLFIPLDMLYENTSIPNDSYIGLTSNEKIVFKDGELASSTTKDAMLFGVEGLIAPMKGMMYIIGIISAAIGVALIYVIVSMIVEENKINISMFKIMGYKDRDLTKIIINTNDLLIVIGFIISIPISRLSLATLFAKVSESMEFTMVPVFTIRSIIIVLIIIIAIYEISKNVSKKKILKISMEEALKNGRE